jgi:hypothetical protein
MKITISNFGPIDSMTFDMAKSFHLIYGKNSIGKSYSTYCLYCLIKNIKGKHIPHTYYYFYDTRGLYAKHSEEIKTILKGVRNGTKNGTDLVAYASDYIHQHIQRQIIPGLKTSLLNTFSSLKILKNAYTGIPYSITFQLTESLTLRILSDEEGDPFLEPIDLLSSWEFIQKKTISTKYSLYVDSKKAVGSPNEEKFTKDFFLYLNDYLRDVFRALDAKVNDVYYLPASRSGLYQALSSFTPILAELTQSRFFLNSKKIELPSLSEPLSDYFIDISTIDEKTVNTQYASIIEDFEKNILDGSVRYDLEARKIKYTPFDINIELDIAEVSSMVAELSPIVIFLKHILHHKYSSKSDENSAYGSIMYGGRFLDYKDVIFIEEPEAHLHPEVQVKLAAIFAELTKHQINIVMTSHSNYMFNKTNNIILSKELQPDSIAVYQLVKGLKGSKCNPEMIIDDEGISDENFVDIAQLLYEERMKILDDNDD